MKRQRGVTLLAMLAILVLGAAWFTVSAVNTPIDRTAVERVHNARILQEAKTALIGYVAQQTAMTGENDPGALPCPEAAGNIGTGNEGIAAGNCTLPAVGRLPWRTLGLDKWRDAAGEPLWYVVSPGWAKPNAATNTVINSNVNGQLTLDATVDIVALIIAPGRPLNVPASANCVARLQTRTTPSPAIDFRDYLECQNANSPIDTTFAGNGPSGSFNDQVLSITAAEVLPAIEAAIAKRIADQIVPTLKTVYNGAFWSAAGTVVFPYAAAYDNPGGATFEGVYSAAALPANGGMYDGLLPFNYSSGCDPATDARCTTTLVTWPAPTLVQTGGTGALWGAPSCSVTTGICEGYYQGGSVTVRFDDRLNGIGKALRTFSPADYTVTVWAYNYNTTVWSNPASPVTTRSLNVDGSYRFRVATATFPSVGWGNWGYYYVSPTRPAIADHPILSGATANTGWFVRNQWYQLLYYAVAPNYAPGGTGTCMSGTSCLEVTNLVPSNTQRAILVLAGRSLTGMPRPNASIDDFLDSAENRNGGTRYEQLKVGRSFNDRVIVLDSN